MGSQNKNLLKKHEQCLIFHLFYLNQEFDISIVTGVKHQSTHSQVDRKVMGFMAMLGSRSGALQVKICDLMETKVLTA